MDDIIVSVLPYLTSTASDFSSLNYKELTSSFRLLRKACTEGSSNQNAISTNEKVMGATHKLLQHMLQEDVSATSDNGLCLQIGLQFIANLIVGNQTNQLNVWVQFQDVLDQCLTVQNEKVQNCCAMILYNIWLGNPDIIENLTKYYPSIFDVTSTSEYSVYIIELFILSSNFIKNFYEDLKFEHRLSLIEIASMIVKAKNEKKIIDSSVVKYFVSYFNKNADMILNTINNSIEELKVVEVVKVLDLIVAFSSDNDYVYFPLIQEETSLLITSVSLLKCVHEVSKQTGNQFSMIQKIAELNEMEQDIQEHPVFGFKGSLIRLIGNMCWNNVKNQDQVRELNCIPVLLDCCNIDGRNPFIIQWTVLAVRNICEKNIENQKFIASMTTDGIVNSARLQEMGITLEKREDGSSVCLAPLVKK